MDDPFDRFTYFVGFVVAFTGTWIAACIALGPIGVFFGWIAAFFFAGFLARIVGFLTLFGLFVGAMGLLYFALMQLLK